MNRRKKKYFETFPGDPEPVVIEVKRRLKFSEVDALAIAWHGRYPAFFEEAHTELMRKVGLTYDAYREHNVGAPIVQCHTDYYAPLLLDENFTIRAELVWSAGARLNVNYEVIKPDGTVAGTGYTVQMFFDVYTHEPAVIPPLLVEQVCERWKNGEFYD